MPSQTGEKHRLQFRKIAKKQLRRSIFDIRGIDDLGASDISMPQKVRLEASRKDSESKFLQQKNFLQEARLRLIVSRQAPILARIDLGRFAATLLYAGQQSSNIVNDR